MCLSKGSTYDSNSYYAADVLYFAEQAGRLYVAMQCKNIAAGDYANGNRTMRVDFTGKPDTSNTSPSGTTPEQFSNAVDGLFYMIRAKSYTSANTQVFQELWQHAPPSTATMLSPSPELSKLDPLREGWLLRIAPGGKLVELQGARLLRMKVAGTNVSADTAFGNAGVAELLPGENASDAGLAIGQDGAVIAAVHAAKGPRLLRVLP